MKMLPPEGFRPALDVRRTGMKFFDSKPKWAKRPHRLTGAQKAGKGYEKKVHRSLTREYGNQYRKSVWIEAIIDGTQRAIEIDGLLMHSDRPVCTIVEVKLKHTIRAWWQLRQLYQPVMTVAFPEHEIQVCEIYQHWDASVILPEKAQHCPGAPDTDTQLYKLCRRSY